MAKAKKGPSRASKTSAKQAATARALAKAQKALAKARAELAAARKAAKARKPPRKVSKRPAKPAKRVKAPSKPVKGRKRPVKAPIPPPTPQPQPLGSAHASFNGPQLLIDVKARAKTIQKQLGLRGVSYSVIQTIRSNPTFTEYMTWITLDPGIAVEDLTSSKRGGGPADVRAQLLHDAFKRVTEVSPWHDRMDRAHIPRGVRYHGSLRVRGINKSRALGTSWSLKKQPSSKKQTGDVYQRHSVDIEEILNNWTGFLEAITTKVNDDAVVSRVRLHVLVPTNAGLAYLRSIMSDREFFGLRRTELPGTWTGNAERLNVKAKPKKSTRPH